MFDPSPGALNHLALPGKSKSSGGIRGLSPSVLTRCTREGTVFFTSDGNRQGAAPGCLTGAADRCATAA